MSKHEVAHVVGNGSWAGHFDHNAKGLRVTCNLPPFEIKNIFTTCMVDFKMMKAITEGSVQVPGYWVLGYRPKMWCEGNAAFYMKYAPQIRQFYTILPDYVRGYTDFSCGHMATHYTCTKHKPKTVHLYGFNSMFDFDLFSSSDLYLNSQRDIGTSTRLTDNWRNIWPNLFKEFSETEFVLHAKHEGLKFARSENVRIEVH